MLLFLDFPQKVYFVLYYVLMHKIESFYKPCLPLIRPCNLILMNVALALLGTTFQSMD